MEESEMMHIVNNMFLPRKLPQKEVAADGGLFVRLVARVLEKHFDKVDFFQEVLRMMNSWGKVQKSSVDGAAVYDIIKSLLQGQTFGLYVQGQNAGLTISIPSNDGDSATLAVFRVSASSSDVMDRDGVSIGIFPGWSATIPAKRVQNVSFAEQVADLANTIFDSETLPLSRKGGTSVPETRDVTDAKYVTSWLLQAVAGHSLITGNEGVARVQKKIRGEVNWENALLPWRRSGEYVAVKVVLHSTLTGSLGDFLGLIAYKLILVRVMSVVLVENYSNLGTDIVMQMLSKLARRLSKLEQLSQRDYYPSCLRLQDFLKQSCALIIDIREVVEKRWQWIRDRESRLSEVTVDKSEWEFVKDTRHLLLTSTPQLQVALAVRSRHTNHSVSDPVCLRRNKSIQWPNVEIFRQASDSVDKGQALYDIEVWVRDVFMNMAPDAWIHRSGELYEILVMYIRLGQDYYKGDCLGSSKLIVTAMTLVALLDVAACSEDPMLRKYHPGVDTTVLQSLLLPLRQDMEHVGKLEFYFVNRSDGVSEESSLISEDVPSPNSFLVRCAEKDPKVQKVREEIEAFELQKQRQKRQEISQKIDEYNRKIRTAASMQCNMRITKRSKYHDSSYCLKCTMVSEAESMTVSIHESLIPEKLHLKNAVVYELVGPMSSWVILRDALHILHRDLFRVGLRSEGKKGTWLSDATLQSWASPGPTRLITLGSSTKSFKQTHYNRPLHPAHHPTESFIQPNGFNVRLMEYATEFLASKKTYVTSGIHVSSLTTLAAEGAYENLQWTMNGTSHDENEVLAKQFQCSPMLSLSEYKAFGTLRAGQRLQVRNIVRALEMKTLSLSEPSVVNLFSQALWETGLPCSDRRYKESWVREPHVDLCDQAFAEYTIKKLFTLCENIESNWKDHLALLSIIVVGARALAFSHSNWRDVAVSLLRRCRKIAEKWSAQIEQVIGTMMASPINEVQRMRSRLVDVAAIGALTFDVDVDQLLLVLSSDDDVTSWLRAVARIYDNILLNSESSMSMFQRNLLRRVQITALRLEDAIRSHLNESSNGLDNFLNGHWAAAKQGHTEYWESYAWPSERWWKTTFKADKPGEPDGTLQMDTLRGSFLVNGCPVGRLPVTITGHQDYKRVFGSHIFQVQPGASTGTFISTHKLNGANFVFEFIAADNCLVVKEQYDDQELELFPSRFLDGDFPELLTRRYSHWIVRRESNSELEPKGRMLFRPIKFDDEKFADFKAVPFELNIKSKCVHEIHRDRKLVDVRSTSFKVLHRQVLYRLELPRFVHVFVDKSGKVSAELPRLGLCFDIVGGNLWSREQPGFCIANEQSLGTLVGLRHGIVLEERDFFEPNREGIICARKRSLLMPHSKLLKCNMEAHENIIEHPVVNIDLQELSSPSFFLFDVDERLRYLRGPASPTAWLYLALLHAVTSHPMLDPFTGLTGAESAMRLLQSPQCWSCKPYESEAVEILLRIAKLSPVRKWYPTHLRCMQTVTWPRTLFSSTALDAYCLVVDKLIEDSKRLEVLFPNAVKSPVLSHEYEKFLQIKAYWRSRNFFGQEAQIDQELEEKLGGCPDPQPTAINLSTSEFDQLKKSTLRSLAEAGHKWEGIPRDVSVKDQLGNLLLHSASLKGVTEEDFGSYQTVSSWHHIAKGKCADHWMKLYNLARQVDRRNRREEFTLLLSMLLFLGGFQPEILFTLLHVAIYANDFKDLDPPEHMRYEYTNQVEFDSAMVRRRIEPHKIELDSYLLTNSGSEPGGTSDEDLSGKYYQSQNRDIDSLVDTARRHWPYKSLTFPSCVLPFSPWYTTVSSMAAARDVESLFTRWRKNKELHEFVSKVEKRILARVHQAPLLCCTQPFDSPRNQFEITESFCYQMPGNSISNPLEADEIFRSGQYHTLVRKTCVPRKQETALPDSLPLYLLGSADCKILEQFTADIRESWSERHRLQSPNVVGMTKRMLVKQLEEKLKACKEKSMSLWKEICAAVGPSKNSLSSRALEAAGLWKRIIPIVLLPHLAGPARFVHSQKNLQSALGAMAVIWTMEQQAERCLRLLNSTTSNDVALQKELVNTGHENWSPKDHPEWLLLELEGDYLMRPIQVDVANKMLNPGDDKNTVLQLNMGEGKTSVIVPALCASIPDGQALFARLTVLSSLFRINFDALKFKLGGLLNRRIYAFPCRRDMKIDAKQVGVMKTVYEECIAKRGVVITRPEHRLSAELMVHELCRAGTDAGPGVELRRLQTYVNERAKDILDESDLILQVKYQVVYTIGQQMNIDGGPLRWKVSQCVLRSAQRHCMSILDEYGPEKIEFEKAKEGPAAFPHIRLLSEELNLNLCAKIADDILEGEDDSLPLRMLSKDDKALIRSFVLPSSEVEVSIGHVQRIIPPGPRLNTILILRGILYYGVLTHALRLRWRVQYGVKSSGKPKMAVPFRAKDVPAERAEYGHPDVAIMLTQLSYYSSGLSAKQLADALERLFRLPAGEDEYQRWLKGMPGHKLPKNVGDLNLDDYEQRNNVVFPSLRRNMRVVDFWLSEAVYPIECKQFEGKLVASAWDLCGDRPKGHSISGFSGTKDTSLLLPTSIIQRDLPQLRGTDGAVIEKILREENSKYYSLPSCISGSDILRRVVDYNACVLLDVGALMVDLSNKQVATTWLELLPEESQIEAAIYFDDQDQIMAIDRNARTLPLFVSPYHRKMACCVVYLDDSHTRGTDLKIPQGVHAFVTLGRGITKDCLVQACMRMRSLGEGHSVSFWASHEVHKSIMSILPSQREPNSMDVLRWVIQNSVQAIKDGFRHWGCQGISYCRKQALNKVHKDLQGKMSLEKLSLLNTEMEIVKLTECYGNDRKVTPLPKIMEIRLQNAVRKMEAEIPKSTIDILILMKELSDRIINKIHRYSGDIKCFAQILDEEQERELEHELEEEEEIERPGEATPHKPRLSPDVRLIATNGHFDPASDEFIPLKFLPLLKRQEYASLWDVSRESDGWDERLFVTQEFATVLSLTSKSSGLDFIRPVAWLVVVPNRVIEKRKSSSVQPVPEAVVLMSAFEVNQLLPDFRHGSGAHLHMFAPRLHAKQDFMLTEYALMLPMGNRDPVAIDHMGKPLIAQLLAFSGSAYFADDDEQSAFCNFLGLCPRPRSKAEDDAFQNRYIDFDGFVHPEKRYCVKPDLETFCHFCFSSPVQFMIKLYSARGWLGHFSSTHVGQILLMSIRTTGLDNNLQGKNGLDMT